MNFLRTNMLMRLLGVLAALALLAAACGDDSSDDGADTTSDSTTSDDDSTDDSAGDATTDDDMTDDGSADDDTTDDAGADDDTTDEPVVLTASDTGVTEDAIRVGVLLVDLEQLETLGVTLGWGDVQAQWDLAIQALNDAGGVGGRQIEPIYETYLPIAGPSMDEPCARLTEDSEVFLALGFFRPIETSLCFSELNDTPVFASADFSLTQEVYDRTAHPVITFGVDTAPKQEAMIQAAHDAGALEGRGIAVHGQNDDLNNAAIESLSALGYDVVSTTVAAETGDPAESAATYATVLERWRADGAEVVINTGSTLAIISAMEDNDALFEIWSYGADALAFDVASGSGTGVEAAQVHVVTGIDQPSLAASGHGPSVECLDRWNEARPDELALTDRGPDDLDNVTQVLQTCAAMDIIKAIAEAAGPELTRESWAANLGAASGLDVAGLGEIQLGDDRWGAPDVLSIWEWDDELGFVSTGSVSVG